MYTEESPQAAITFLAGIYLAENPSLSEFTRASGSIHTRHHSAWAQPSWVLSPFNSSWSCSVLWCSAPYRDEDVAQDGYSLVWSWRSQFLWLDKVKAWSIEMKIQRRCIRDPRGSSGTSGSGVYITSGTQARLFNASSGISSLHYRSDVS